MRRSFTLFTLSAVFAVLALAESFQGRLLDATCYQTQKSAATCDPTSSTTTFALFVANKAYALDAAGNTKTAEALKGRADRSADPAKPPNAQVMAKITGTKGADDSLTVDTVEIQ